MSVKALATPLGMSAMPDGASIVSCFVAILMWLAADVVVAPFCGLVASKSTFSDAIACNCVAFSSTLPESIKLRRNNNEKISPWLWSSNIELRCVMEIF